MRFAVILSIAATVLSSGCASIVSGTTQSVSVVGKTPENIDVMGARCTLTNNKGEWYTTTPGSVVVHRSYGELAVNCMHPTAAGVIQVKSSTKGMAFGNILFGGVIGVGIDMANGSAYEYPQLIAVSMTSTLPPAPAPWPVALPAPAPAAAPLQVAGPVLVSVSPLVPVPPPTLQAVPVVSAGNGNVVPLPAAAEALKAVYGGQEEFGVQRLAKAQACHTQPRPIITGKGPGFETYSVACESGDSLAIRCEFGNCRVLR